MIRVLLVDDHTAVRAGLLALIRSEPGLKPIGCCGSSSEALAASHRGGPDVVVLDYHLRDGDGLSLCRMLKRLEPAPAVVVYSAFASGRLALASIVAGADCLLEKGAPADELFEAIRVVASGRHVLSATDREQLSAAAEALDADDVPILGMLMERVPAADIAAVLRVSAADVEQRIDTMVRRLRPPAEGSLQAAG
jgi:DNA-binding NarL/FixJ family response regulator